MRTVLLIGFLGCAAAASLGHAVTAAESPAFRAVALVCPAGVEGPDCSRENALDIAVQPVAHETECGLVGQVLASHLTLQPGERHKIACERRRG